MFTFAGDHLWLYNLPGRPLLDWVSGILFYLGVFIAVRRFRRIEYALALFWLVAGIFPSLLTGVVASTLRSIAAQPIVYFFVATGAVEAVRGLERLEASRVIRSVPLGLLLVAVSISTAHDYFDVWGPARDVRVAYHTTLLEIARYLEREAEPGATVAISSIYPNRFHDPYSMELMLRRDDLSFRWFTGSFVDMFGVPHAGLVFPRGEALVVTQAIAPIDPVFADLFARYARRVATVELRPDDLNPRFEVYRFDSDRAFLDTAALLPRPANGATSFGNLLHFLGYDVRTPQVEPGGVAEVVTLWQFVPTIPTEQDVVLFTHVLTGDPNRPVLTQQDSLDVSLVNLKFGEGFAQVHRFAIPPDAAPGTYPIEIGAYTRADGVRLRVRDETGSEVGDQVMIGSIEVIVP
jgi:hypothetical protein